MNRLFITTVVALLALLGLSALWSTAGKRDNRTWPSAYNDGPTGTSALAELLRQKGFSVRIDSNPVPILKPNDLAIAFSVRSTDNSSSDKAEKKVGNHLLAHAYGGGALLMLPVSEEANQEVVEAHSISAGNAHRLNVGTQLALDSDFEWMPEEARVVDLWWDKDDAAFVEAGAYGSGLVVVVADGVIGVNRHLARYDNAALVLNVIQATANHHQDLVFVEASFGGGHSSLLSLIGPWAKAAWQQLLFVFVLIIFMLGQRFGLPEEIRPSQVATRELIDAVADTMHRTRAGRMVLRLTLESADHDLRQALRLPKSAERSKRDDRLPESLVDELHKAEAALSMESLPWTRGVEIARALDRATQAAIRSGL